MAHLTISGLTKIFPGGVKALDNFTMEIKDGEFIAIVGPSGCGKSTLLRLIAGLEEEQSGTIELDGSTLNGLPPKKRDMAVMFQNYAMFPHLTVEENIGFGLKVRGTEKKEIQKRVLEVASTLGIEDLLKRYPSEMSGGQRQRAALGRAILRHPKVFLFDEPLSNLDAKMRAQMRIEISKLHQRLRSTMIFVTHDQIEAMTMGDRIVVLKDGIIQQIADADTLYNNPENAFVASFIGTPGINLFAGTIIERDDKLFFESQILKFPINPKYCHAMQNWINRDIQLGIRPEDIGSKTAWESQYAPTLTGTLGVIEKLGDSICLYFQANETEWAARTIPFKPNNQPKTGENTSLPVNTEKALFFEPKSGQTIRL